MTTTQTQGANAGEDDLTALTRTMAQRMEGMFAPFRGTWDEEALTDYGLDFARAAVGKVELAKGQLSTFVCTVVKRRLLDLHRTLRRGKKRIDAHGGQSDFEHLCKCGGLVMRTRIVVKDKEALVDGPCKCVQCGAKSERPSRSSMVLAPTPGVGRAFEDVDETLPLNEWAGAIYRQATLTLGRRHMGRAANGGQAALAPAQEAALLAIKRRLKLSNQGVISLLVERPLIARSLRIKYLPSRQKIWRLCNRFTATPANKRASGRSRSNRMASEYVTESQAAELVALSKVTLSRWRRKKNAKWKLKIYRPGGRVRYLRSEVVRWMEAQATPPAVGVKG